MSSYTALIESVVDNEKRRVLVEKNALRDNTARYIGVYGGHLGIEGDVIYIFDECYETLCVNNKVIKTPEWVLALCTRVKKKKKKKEGVGGKRKWYAGSGAFGRWRDRGAAPRG